MEIMTHMAYAASRDGSVVRGQQVDRATKIGSLNSATETLD